MLRLILVTGPLDSGKTTVLSHLASFLKGQGPRPSGLPPEILPEPPVTPRGIVTSAEVEGRRKTAYTAKPLGEDGEWPLVSESPSGEGWLPGPGRFYRSPRGFFQAAEYLLSRLEAPVLILDEAGPLEMAGQGHAPLLDKLVRAYSGILILTVRNNLSREAALRWGGRRNGDFGGCSGEARDGQAGLSIVGGFFRIHLGTEDQAR